MSLVCYYISMNKRNLIYILIIVFALSLIPLYVIGGYAHPSVDDYHYGAATSKVWQETGSLGEVFDTAAELTKDSYNTWQGNFTAIFLMYLRRPSTTGRKRWATTPRGSCWTGSAGEIVVSYEGTTVQKISDAISLLTWVGLAVYGSVRRYHYRKKLRKDKIL